MTEAVKDAIATKPLSQDQKCNLPPEIQRIQSSKSNGNWYVYSHIYCDTDSNIMVIR